MKKIFFLFTFLVGLIYACQKIDYSQDIESLRQQVNQINQRLDSLTSSIKLITSQINNIETTIKTKLDNAGNRIDSISSALGNLKNQVNLNSSNISVITKSVTSLSSDIFDINARLIQTDKTFKNRTDSLIYRMDSSNKVIRGIDSSLSIATVSNDSLKSRLLVINSNYNVILTNYLELLTIVKGTSTVFLIKGKIEKGPFSQGSIISLYELDTNLSQTGKSYSTTIDDNQGNYDLQATGLGGKMFRVNSDGFYYNEVMNTLSTSRIVLTGISKIDSSENVNVNVLTHLERRRVQYLMTEKKLSYDSAKKTAVTELLAAFELGNNNISRAEKVNLFNSQNDILLNISILLQGYRTDAQLTELLTDFSNDFYLDGSITDLGVKKALYNHAFILDTATIRRNLKTKFNYSLSSFLPLSNYINKSSQYSDLDFMPFSYPPIFNGKKNYLERISIDSSDKLCATCGTLVFINKGISSLEFKVKITGDSIRYVDSLGVVYNDWFINPESSQWGYSPSIYGSFCPTDNPCSQTYTSKNAVPELNIAFNPGKYYIDFYEPSTSAVPTFRKTLVIK